MLEQKIDFAKPLEAVFASGETRKARYLGSRNWGGETQHVVLIPSADSDEKSYDEVHCCVDTGAAAGWFSRSTRIRNVPDRIVGTRTFVAYRVKNQFSWYITTFHTRQEAENWWREVSPNVHAYKLGAMWDVPYDVEVGTGFEGKEGK
ncbi:MAG: hypothetical protein ABFD89_03555 [Bryobacteraceae bacterium]